MRKILSLIIVFSISLNMFCFEKAEALEVSYEITPMMIGNVDFALILKSDGSVWGWGKNESGQIGIGTDEKLINQPRRALIDNVCRIATTGGRVMALKTDGTLWGWGDWSNNHGRSVRFYKPVQIMENVWKFGADYSGGWAIKTDASLWLWKPNSDENAADVACKEMENVIDFSAADGVCAAVKTDHTLWTWEEGKEDEEMIKMADNAKEVYMIRSSDKTRCCYAISKDDCLWEYSRDTYHSTNVTGKMHVSEVKLFKKEDRAFVLRKDNTLWCKGDSGLAGYKNSKEYIKVLDGVKDFSCAGGEGMVIKEDNALYAWGTHSALPKLGYKEVHKTPVKLMDNVLCFPSSYGIFGGRDMIMTTDGTVYDLKWKSEKKSYEFESVLRYTDFVIHGESSVMKNDTVELQTIYYNDENIPCYANDVMWYCNSPNVEIKPIGAKIQVRGLKQGTAEIKAVHNQKAVIASFTIAVNEYKLSLDNRQIAVVDYDKELDYTISLKGNELKTNETEVSWRVENTEGNGNEGLKIKNNEERSETLRRLTVECREKGIYNLVATVNGTEIDPVSIEVVGSLYETAEDESVVKARVLSNNSAYKYYTSRYVSSPRIITEGMNVNIGKVYNFFDKIFENGPSCVSYYELVLWDIFQSQGYQNSADTRGTILEDKLYQNLMVKVAECADGDSENSILSLFEDDLTKLLGNKYIDYAPIVEGLFLGMEINSKCAEATARSGALGLLSSDEIGTLKKLEKCSSNKNLKKACENIVKEYSEVNKENFAKGHKQEATFSVFSKNLKEKGFEAIIAAKKAGSIIVAGGVNDLLLNVDDVTEQIVILCAYVEIEDALKKALVDAEEEFKKNPNLVTAGEFMTLADFYKAVLTNGCIRTQEYIRTIEKGISNVAVYLVGDLTVERAYSPFGKDVKIEEMLKTASSTQKIIQNADFYSTEGNDIVKYLQNVHSVTPSSWAKEEVDAAIQKGLLPDYMQNNYQRNLTRAEFCTIMTCFISEKTNQDIETVIKERGTPIKSPFKDTYYEYVDYMYKLGVVSGVGEDNFDPLGEITREQAATMLKRAAEILGYNTAATGFAEEGVSVWAQDAVGFVAENSIMKGTGNGFDPKGKFTKEQAILTVLRMYDGLK